MKIDNIARSLAAAILAASTLAVPAAAVAQSARAADQPMPAVAHPTKGVINLPCCRCVDGSQRTSVINTGSIPWRVTGPSVAAGAIGQAITSGIHPQWTATGSLPPAKWIHPNTSNGQTNQPAGVYTYSVTIVVPRCIIPMRVVLSGEAAGDDQITVFLGTTQIGTTPFNASPSPAPAVNAGAGGWGFRKERIVSFTQPLTTGTHTLRIEVTNGGLGPHGLIVRGAIRSQCPREGGPANGPADPIEVETLQPEQ